MAVEIPWQRLQPDTLRRVIDEFVTREGTDYGERAFTLDEKARHVLDALRAGRAAVFFDEETDSCQVVTRE